MKKVKNKKFIYALIACILLILLAVYCLTPRPILKEGRVYECTIEVNGASSAKDGYKMEYRTDEYSEEIAKILSKYEYSILSRRVLSFGSEVEYRIDCESWEDDLDIVHIYLGEDGYNIVNDGKNHYRIINHESLRAEIDSLLNNYD